MRNPTLLRPRVHWKQALVIAPALALLPLSAAAQNALTVNCAPEEECHVAPYFHGTGGFVGQALPGKTSVDFWVACGNTVRTLPATPGANGRVAQAITGSDACGDGDNGVLVTQGLQDGGWYYMNDPGGSSAIAPLVPLSVLSDPARSQTPYDPGGLTVATNPGISINGQSYSSIGTFFKHPGGRVGLFPHAAATRRTPRCADPAATGPENDCHLNAMYTARIEVTDAGVSRGFYQNGDTITRKAAGTGDLTLVPGVQATGNIVIDTAFDEFGGGAPTVTGDNTHEIGAASGAMGTVDIQDADAAGERCDANSPDRNTALPVKWTFTAANIVGDAPRIMNDLEVEVMVACPAVAAGSHHRGVELVPNPQPADG